MEKKKDGRLYIAYGSNLNISQMRMRCPDSRIIGTAEIRNWRLLFRRSYLTIEPTEKHLVPVAIWKVSETDEKSLDLYEGYPRFYVKKDFILDVKTKKGILKDQKCFAYVMADGFPLEFPTEYYLSVCLDGYRSFGFDRGILAKALEETRAEN